MRKKIELMKIEREYLLLLAPAVYLFVLPLAHTTALRSVAFGISALLLLATWRRFPAASIPLKAPFTAWLILAMVSLIWAVRPEYSINEIRNEILQGFVTFLIYFKATRSSRELRFWMFVIFASALATGLTGLIHLLHELDPYAVGTLYAGALSYAGYVTTVVPILAAIAILCSVNARAGVLFLILFLLLIAGWTTNRGIWVYLLTELVVFGSLYLMRVALQGKARTAAIAIVVGSIIVSTGALFFAAKGRLGGAGGPTEIIIGTAKADRRPQLWNDSIARIRERPFTGVGFGRMVLSKEMQEQQQDIHHTHAHNILLNYAIQLGLLGPVVLIFIFCSVAKEFWKLLGSPVKKLRTLGIAGIAVVTGIFAEGIIEDMFIRHIAWLFWALVGMILGYAMNKRAEKSAVLTPQ
jgi:O-antigen ligase